MTQLLKTLLFLAASTCFALAGCSSNGPAAPIVNITGPTYMLAPPSNTSSDAAASQPASIPTSPTPAQHTYTVKKGDTLYSIAWSAGLDYETLAALNHIKPPYILSLGQVIQLGGAKQESLPSPDTANSAPASIQTVFWSPKKPLPALSVKKVKQSITAKPHFQWRPHWSYQKTRWIWPIKGRVLAGFSMAPGGNRGLNITSTYGTPIKAAAAGEVVYSGSGVRGYGNIIIIKNARHFLTAYAFNAKNMVKDGEMVQQGQTIATMGRNTAGQVMLHFEIRYYGKAVDPMRYLPKR